MTFVPFPDIRICLGVSCGHEQGKLPGKVQGPQGVVLSPLPLPPSTTSSCSSSAHVPRQGRAGAWSHFSPLQWGCGVVSWTHPRVLTFEDRPVTDALEAVHSTGQGPLGNELCQQIPGIPGAHRGEQEEHDLQDAWGQTRHHGDPRPQVPQDAGQPCASSPDTHTSEAGPGFPAGFASQARPGPLPRIPGWAHQAVLEAPEKDVHLLACC